MYCTLSEVLYSTLGGTARNTQPITHHCFQSVQNSTEMQIYVYVTPGCTCGQHDGSVKFSVAN
jgi:hypothetical protein